MGKTTPTPAAIAAILSSIISMTEKGDGNLEKADAQHELENLRAHSAPTAIFGSSRRARMKSGEKNVAPPIPARLAIQAMPMAFGKSYQ